MRAVSWVWLWYVLVGFVIGGTAVYLWHVAKENALKFKWYELILIVLAYVMFMFGAQTFIASLGEGESRAAWMTVIFLGVPMVIIGVVTYRSVHSRLAAA